MSINSNAAFNMINKYNFIITYFFFLNYVYKDLIKKNFLGNTFFSKIKDFLSDNTTFTFLCKQCKQKNAHYNLDFLNRDICPLGFQNKIMSALSRKDSDKLINTFNDIRNIKSKFIEGFYELLINSFSNSNLKYNLFSIFKSKDKKDNSHYLLLGKIKLEKNLSDNCKFNFYSLFNTFENCKYIPIGDYFIFVKFTFSNYSVNPNNLSNILRKLNNNSYLKREILFTLTDVKYIATEKEIDNRFELVNENIV